jgi:methylated-DNA-[protein]-cysteine S-methyltransferase
MNDLEHQLGQGPDTAFDVSRFQADLGRRASQSGLLDVAYAAVDSPLGDLTVFVTPRGLVRLAYEGEAIDATLQELAERVSPRILHAPERTDNARRELEAYFAGRLHAFTQPVDWSLIRGFAAEVLHATARIPFGSVSTYGRMAIEAGSPRAARAAGNALGSNPIPIVVPCHRVLHADGGLGGYSGGLHRKRFLLQLEGTLPA